MHRLFVLPVLLGVLAGLLPAGAADPPATSMSPEVMDAGKKLDVIKCARCHKFYNPAGYSDAKWHEWMDKMSKKAKLKPEQKELLSKYLETFRFETKTNSTMPAHP